MGEETFRIEWRETEAQRRAATGIATQYAARWDAIVGALAALAALAHFYLAVTSTGTMCFTIAFGVVCARQAFSRLRAYSSARSRVSADTVRSWIEARARRAEGFREPAREDAGGVPLFVSLGPAWLELGSKGCGETRLHWSSIRSVVTMRGGHVLLRGQHGTTGALIPAWAFEASEQRAQFIEQARARAAAARVPYEAPGAFEAESPAFAISLPYSFASSRLAYRKELGTSADLVLFGLAATSSVAAVIPSALFEVLPDGAWGALLGAGPLIAAVWSASWVHALAHRAQLRRHVVQHLRFSESGVEYASAIASWTRSWDAVSVVERPYLKTIVIDGVALPRSSFSDSQLARVRAWKLGAVPDANVMPPFSAAPPRQGWKVLGIWVVLILMFAAVYHLVTSEDDPPPPEVTTVLPEASCALPVSQLPGVALPHDPDACAELTFPDDPGNPSVMSVCAELPHPLVDRVAIVVRPSDQRAIAWLRDRGVWREAGTVARWTSDEQPFFDGRIALTALQLGEGSAPEILVSIDAPSGLTTRRYLSAVALHLDLTPRVWWTIVIGEAGERACWSYLVAASHDPDPTYYVAPAIVLHGHESAPFDAVPPRSYAPAELVTRDVFSDERSDDGAD